MNFHGSHFENYDIDFSHSIFEGGKTNFDDTKFINCSLDFSAIHQKNGIFAFSAKDLTGCKKINFSGSTFECPIYLNEIKSPCLLDFTATKLDHPIDFSQANIGHDVKTYGSNSSAQFRCLKKLAKDAEDHDRATEFYAREIRSNYDHRFASQPAIRFAYQTYDKISNFGRSFWRPAIILICIMLNMATFYTARSSGEKSSLKQQYQSAFILSASNSLPIYPISNKNRSEARDHLCNKNEDNKQKYTQYNAKCTQFNLMSIVQSIISTFLLFLMGLALRNRFRS